MMSGVKHKVKLLKHDSDRKCVELEVNGEKVRVEKFTEEDWKELYERGKKENLSIEYIATDYFPFEKEGESSEVVFQRMALAAYRLLWCFGPPLSIFHTPPRSVYTFSLKYKGYIFSIHDELSGRALTIHSVHLVPKEEKFDKRKYVPPEEIREEIASIIEHLITTPAKMYAGDFYVLV